MYQNNLPVCSQSPNQALAESNLHLSNVCS